MLKSARNGDDGTAMPPERWRNLNPAQIVVIFLVAHVMLELGTHVPSYSPLGITPWNPGAGLGFALVLLLGLAYVPLLVVAPLLADLIVRHTSLPVWVEVVEVLLTSSSYIAALWLLRLPNVGFDPGLRAIRDLLVLVAVAIVATAVVAVTYVAVLRMANLLPASEMVLATMRYWAGEMIGILVVAPAVLILAARVRLPRLGLEGMLQGLSIVLAVGVVVGVGPGYQQQLFYLLFLPMVWIAVRGGLEGISAGLLSLQVGLMAALHLGLGGNVDVDAFQAVMLVLTFSGLAIGILISERERAVRQLRAHEAEMARVGRITGLGSLTSSIAHEINQPLTAIGNYVRVVQRALEASPPAMEAARGAAAKAVAQVDRAAGVVRGLRELLHSGRAEVEPQPVAPIMAEALELLAPEISAAHARLDSNVERGLGLVLADRLQVEQVIVNLVRNGLEAMRELPVAERQVTVSAVSVAGGGAEIRVTDRGPGFPQEIDPVRPQPGRSEKPDGLGLGLALCRSILEAHGSRLAHRREAGVTLLSFRLAAAHGGDTTRGGEASRGGEDDAKAG